MSLVPKRVYQHLLYLPLDMAFYGKTTFNARACGARSSIDIAFARASAEGFRSSVSKAEFCLSRGIGAEKNGHSGFPPLLLF
ncbi:hypothetical protein R83H12_02643 [Fibrobacteria bacterium R8-3-H12]